MPTRRVSLATLIAMAVALFTFAPLAFADVTLVNEGKPSARIVLPEKTEYEKLLPLEPDRVAALIKESNPEATPAAIRDQVNYHMNRVKNIGDEEVSAAEELQTIVEKITGAKLPIERAKDGKPPGGAVILIGAELAKNAGQDARMKALDTDGLLVTTKGDALVLTGSRARGTLYAAYEFLESLGCRWVCPGEFGELYPSTKTVTTKIDTLQNPSHTQRSWWCTYGAGKEYTRWTLRNKGTFLGAIGDDYVAAGHALAGPLAWGATNPKYAVKEKRKVEEKKKAADGTVTTEMVEKEMQVLPDEYYALADGKVNRHVPNFSNPKAWDLYADYYIDYFRRNPLTNYVSISAEDGFVIDEHPESMKLRSNDYDFAMGAFCATDQLWFFHNRVIEKVTRVFPKKKFGVLVYANNMMPPRIERVHPNMALVFAPLGISPLTPVGDTKERTNVAYKDWFEDWMAQARAAKAESYYYDYEPMGFCWNMAMICPRWGIIGKNYPYFHKQGLNGHTTQGHDDWASCGLDNYLMIRLYWNVNTPYKEVIADYCRARFGAAAPMMQAYYDRYEKALDDAPDLYSNEMWANHLILTPAVRKEAREILAKAIAAVDTDRAKAHVRNTANVQAMTDTMCDAIEYASETGDFGGSAKMMEKTFEIADKLNKLYSHFANPQRMNKDSNAQFETGGQYKQFLGFDKRIKSAAASVTLPRYWKGMLDSGNRAWAMGYYKPDVSVDKLEDQDTTICPDVKYKTQRSVAAFFYRTSADVPASFQGKKSTLYFSSVIARGLQVWINGEPVEFDNGTYKDTTLRGPDYFWFNYNHEMSVNITPYIKPGQKNTIAFRTFKSFDFGGTYRRIFLLAE